MHTSLILADFQKAFDTLEHGALLEKMKYLVPRHLQLNGLSLISERGNFLFVLVFFLTLKL